jgi:regulator of PEP synthase PpsR (kinase-PPPase family)
MRCVPVKRATLDAETVVSRHHFNLHLVSDATGETLIAASRAVVAQYEGVCSVEHVYPMVRSPGQLDKAIAAIESAPGMVLFTLVDPKLAERLTEACSRLGMPCLSILAPIMNLFESYIGRAATPRPGAQHILNADYFRRIDALNFTMLHDDGQHSESYETADVLILGVSRTSKTPTSIYLANRGVKTANLPFVPNAPLPKSLENLRNPLVVGLLASPERIVQIRQNRLAALNGDPTSPYVDRRLVADEVAQSRKLFEDRGWPTIDVTRRSIEETAAAIIDLHKLHKLKFITAT